MKLAEGFQLHQMPPGALPCRCHILRPDKARIVEDYLVKQLPTCYIASQHLKNRAEETGLSASEVLANKLPDPGHVMSGDFAEILTLFFLGSERQEKTVLVKKWRFKQDRLKSAPHSDVIILYRKDNKSPSSEDFVICAESKQKATASSFIPIAKAMEGFEKDRTGRLARTLLWLREKAIDSGSISMIEYLQRFVRANPVSFFKYYKAVAIIDREILDAELSRPLALPEQNANFEVVVLGINRLYEMYNKVYQRAIREVQVG